MEGWKYYEGKNIFVILKNKRQYSGIVLEVESTPDSPIVFIHIKDKFGNKISVVNSEIELMQEEK